MTTAPTEPPAASTDPSGDVERPPLPWLLGYRVLGLRLPERYRPWVARDVVSRGFLTWRMGRTFLWGLALGGLYWVAQTLVHRAPARRAGISVVAVALAAALLQSGATLVRGTLRWQRVDRHGRPVTPKGLARLDNQQALLLGTATVVAFTAVAALVFGFGQRPTRERCPAADAATLERIRAGFTDRATTLEDPQQLTYRSQKLVGAYAGAPGDAGSAKVVFWLVDGEQVFELRGEASEPVTSFQPPTKVDRGFVDALVRVAKCLSDARK